MTKKQQEKTLDIFEEAIRDKTKEYNKACIEIERDIASINANINQYDYNAEAEARNETRFLEGKLSKKKQDYERDIAGLTVETKQK